MVDIYDPPAILDHDLDRDRPRGRSHLPREPRQATQREVLSDQNTASPTSKVQVSLLPIQKSRQPGTSQVLHSPDQRRWCDRERELQTDPVADSDGFRLQLSRRAENVGRRRAAGAISVTFSEHVRKRRVVDGFFVRRRLRRELAPALGTRRRPNNDRLADGPYADHDAP